MTTTLLDRLRSDTRDAHMALEAALALMGPPLLKDRFVHALQGFLAFHRVWQPRMDVLIGDEALLAPRRRIDLIERDLRALGASEGAARDLRFDLRFLTSPSAAWGSLYVLEGSTLGGMVISKALGQAPWAPAEGLAYFSPYGRRTGEMWAGFRSALEAAAPTLEPGRVIEGATTTFATLRAGVAPALDDAA